MLFDEALYSTEVLSGSLKYGSKSTGIDVPPTVSDWLGIVLTAFGGLLSIDKSGLLSMIL